MTTPDIYTIEARRLTANSLRDEGFSKLAEAVLRGDCDRSRDQRLLAATLRELNWQPPVDPDLVEARKVVAAVHSEPNYSSWARQVLDGQRDGSIEIHCALAAIKRGRELERGASTPQL